MLNIINLVNDLFVKVQSTKPVVQKEIIGYVYEVKAKESMCTIAMTVFRISSCVK